MRFPPAADALRLTPEKINITVKLVSDGRWTRPCHSAVCACKVVCMTYIQARTGRPTVYIPHEPAEIRVVGETWYWAAPRTRRSSRSAARA